MKLHVLLVAAAIQLAVAHGENSPNHHGVLKKRQTSNVPGIPALADITGTMTPPTPPTFVATHKPGEQGPIPGSPKIPTPKSLSAWPAQDKIPDVNSPEVKEWMKELEGVNIPNIRPTLDSTCAADPEAARDAAKNGWWTCGGHTRPTDIVRCPTKLDWGSSYDDGPSPYTPWLLEKLKQENLKTTFFVVGSRVIERPAMVVEEYMRGHEISVHTWSHKPLTTLTTEQIVAELGWTRKAIKSVIGITPTTMRPPRGDIDDRVRAISLAMGLVPIMWTLTPAGQSFDTFDWLIPDSKSNGTHHMETFRDLLTLGTNGVSTGFVTLQHDLYPSTVGVSVGYTLDAALAHQPKYNIRPIGECNNIPATNLYFETNQNTTFPPPGRAYDIDGDGKAGGASATTVSVGLLSLASLLSVGLLL